MRDKFRFSKKKQLADITVRGYFRREVLLIKRFWRIE